ncbi:hypothetical protein QMA10_04955 [Arthrobacter sp. APC 3897]|uniref:hypothetical protein n=1 Tax=Arthrobacter sp. APC 3897 TaxID=3035204 RepID=UPI0025B49889|nr:hypothetical protein [Arthrobacter sp. APC 3897]MDN3481271.1 hypothetical protein [Arthrobacter sp. APC 3897]
MSAEIPARPDPLVHGTSLAGRVARLVSVFYGDAERNRFTEPVRHLHDDLENEIDEQLRTIRVETDASGRHYGVQITAPKDPEPPWPELSYRNYSLRPPLSPDA